MRLVAARAKSPVLVAAVAAVAAAGLLAVAAAPAQAQSAPPELASPRATFDTFLSAMNDVKRGRDARLDDAVACLDLSGVSALVRGEAGRIAGDLKTFLDKTELIRLEEIPEDPGTARWTWRRDRHGEVSLVRRDDGRWLFSPETIDSLPALLDSVRDRDFVEGLETPGGGPRSFADRIRDRMPSWGRERLLLLEIWQWFGLLGLILAGVIADRLARWIVQPWLRRLLRKSEHVRDEGVVGEFGKPIGILVMALVWWGLLPLLGLPLLALAALIFAAKLVAALSGVWAAYKAVDVAAAHVAGLARNTQTQIDDILVPMARRALKILVIAFGVVFVASNLDIDVTSLLAGLGIGGIAFALAAKDTVENLFGSVTVLTDRPFQIGDWVKIGDQEGTVEEIGFRSTRIRTFYNSLITIPNALLVRSAVDNLGLRRYRRYSTKLGVQYDTPPDRLEAFCEGIRELVRRHPYTRKDYYMVYLNEFQDSSLGILLYVFFETPDWPTELRERHRLMLDIVRLAQALGVSFAFPTRTLHVADVPPALHGAVSVPGGGAGAGGASGRGADGDRPGAAGDDPAARGRAEAGEILRRFERESKDPPVTF